ncbi:hypothetical protein Tco_1316135 [Tanacetum coccineum]
MERQQSQADVTKMIAVALQQEGENLRSDISSQINDAISNHIPSQVDSSVRNYMSWHILHLQHDNLPIWFALKFKFERLHVSSTPCKPSALRTRDQEDPYDDAHLKGENDAKRQKMSKYGTFMFGESSSGQDYESKLDDDEFPTENVSQELVEEMSQTVDEAKLRKVVDEMLRQQCTSRDEHQYHIDQMQNFLKNDILDFLMMILKKELPDIVARRSNGSIVSITESDYKNLTKNDIKDMYLLIINKHVYDYVKTGMLWSLLVFIRSTVIWERVHNFQLGVESYQQKVNLTTPTISFPGIKKYKVFSIIFQPVYGIIYENSKKEKRVISIKKFILHKFYDATLKRVLERLKSYNNNVKHGYVTPSLNKEDVEYLKLFKEEIKEWLKHSDQMRRWEMFLNERPLGLRRERPE